MRIAVLISGSPRFCAGFDTFINGLTEFETVDWYVDLWSNNPSPDKLGYDNHVLVAPSWRQINQEWAVNKIKSNLSSNQRLVALSLYDSGLIEYPIITGPQVHHTNFPSIWKMHLGWKRVDLLRQSIGIQYDLIIRARPDVYLTSTLNLITIKNLLNQSPNCVFVSNGGQHGYGYNTNDIIAISSPNNMSIYTDLINHSIKYNNEGIMFHPETLLAYHMKCNGLISTPMLGVELRLDAVTLPDGTVTVDFGRWQ
jgi:hypothetical protein